MMPRNNPRLKRSTSIQFMRNKFMLKYTGLVAILKSTDIEHKHQPNMVSAVLHFLVLSHIYHNPYSDLLIRGDPTAFKKFDGIDQNLRPGLKHLELNNVEFEPAQLVDSLQNCSSLQTLNLKRVKWTGDFNTRVTLPELQEFKLQIKNMKNFKSLNKGEFKALLFFDKDSSVTWKIEELPSLPIDITVNYGIQSIQILHEKRKLELIHIPFSNELLRSIKPTEFPVENLNLFHATLNAGAVPKDLTYLWMSQVSLRGGDLGSMFKKLKKLETADLEEITGDRFVPATLDISSLPSSTLQNLYLTSLTVTQLNPIEFAQLYKFRLMACDVSPDFLKNFGQTFKNVKEVEIMAKEPVENHSLLKAIIQETTADKVHFSNFQRNSEAESGDAKEIEEFLARAGVPADLELFSLEMARRRWKWINPAKVSVGWKFWKRWE